MLLYRINRLRAIGGGMVLRYCEGQFGVTRREWVMLALLSTDESLQPSELALRADLDRPAISKAITGMIKKGLVARELLRGDRRIALLRLTSNGRKLYEEILPVVAGINSELMSALSGSEIALLDAMLQQIEARAEVMAVSMSKLPRADRRGGGTRRVMKSSTFDE
ncbi:MarR family winged helix-turn-helix transcriptional regulator [soil metagenome]